MASQNQIEAFRGSEVFPVWLPARDQPINVIVVIGSKDRTILRKACLKVTSSTRETISYPFRILRINCAVSLGVFPTFTPTASNASCFAAAVPEEPETIAPA